MPVRWPRINNPFAEFNLPPDYDQLTADGRKQARLNACACRETPSDMVAAWHFYRNYYLNHDQAYFYKDFAPSPPLHFEMIALFRDSRSRKNAVAAPRGYSKSTVIGTEVPLLEMCSPSKPAMEIGITLAKDSFVEERFDKFMVQLEENPRVIEDFGKLKPDMGSGIWNRHLLRLRNRVLVKGYSVDGKKRGGRPDLMIIDDPEHDPSKSTNLEVTSEDLDDMLVREILGMLPPTARLFWIGTLLHRRAFLYHILRNDDPRFRTWNKRLYAENAHPENVTDASSQLLWGSRFTKDFLIEQKNSMGVGGYMSEMCNDPRSSSDSMLHVDGMLNEYDIEPSQTPQFEASPLTVLTPTTYYDVGNESDGRVTFTETTKPFADLIRPMRRFLMVDYAPTDKPTSDYSAIVVVGQDDRNTVWVLDAWQKRCRPAELIEQIWNYGQKWQVSLVGIEAVGLQDDLRQQVADSFELRQAAGIWVPKVVPIKYANKVSKSDRIASLEWRFRKGRIKLPRYLKDCRDSNHTFMGVLYDQIVDFTMDLSRLPKDDLVDTLSMYHTLVKGASKAIDVPTKALTLQERLLAGETEMREYPAISVISGLKASEITPEMIEKMYEVAGHSSRDRADENKIDVDDGTGDWFYG